MEQLISIDSKQMEAICDMAIGEASVTLKNRALIVCAHWFSAASGEFMPDKKIPKEGTENLPDPFKKVLNPET